MQQGTGPSEGEPVSCAKEVPVRRFTTGFPVRCTDEEKKEIAARADRANRSISRFLVELALVDAASHLLRSFPVADPAALEAAVVQLRRLIGTLNELMADPAVAHGVPEPTSARLASVITDIEDLIAELWSGLV
jgi:hypothetical protein